MESSKKTSEIQYKVTSTIATNHKFQNDIFLIKTWFNEILGSNRRSETSLQISWGWVCGKGTGFDLCNINSFVPLRRQVPSSTGSIWPLLDLYTENRRIEASSIHEV